MPLTPAYIQSLCDHPHSFSRGEAYYHNEYVRITADAPCQGGSRLVVASVRGSGSNVYKTNIQLSPSGGELLSYGCSCPAYRDRIGFCKHLVALALTVAETQPAQLRTPAAGKSAARLAPRQGESRTDAEVSLMLQKYARSAAADAASAVSADGSAVALVPTLHLSSGNIPVSFRLGTNRLYILKDLPNFLATVALGGTATYGKQLAFTHTLSAFSAQGQTLVRFLQTYCDSRNILYADSHYYLTSSERGRYLFLAPFMLDSLLELYEGQAIELDDGRDILSCAVKRQNPQLQLRLRKNARGGYFLSVSEPFALLRGSKRIYLQIGPALFACDEEFSAATRDFFTGLERGRKQQLTIAEADMPALTATLLSQLSPWLPISSASDLSAFQPPPLQSRVYLDLPTPELVTARLEHWYGDRSHPGFLDKALSTSLDLRGEVRLETLLRRYFPQPYQPGAVCIDRDEDALYQLVDRGVAELSELAQVFASDAFGSVKLKPPAAVSVGVRMESDLLRLSFDLRGIELAELGEVLASYHKAKKYHRLRDGSFLSLEDSALSEFSELASGLDLTAKEILSGEVSVAKYRTLYLDSLLRSSERIRYDRDGAFKKLVRDIRDAGDADFPIPDSLRSILRTYQKVGYRWLRTIAWYGFGGILADDMGLGKTLQILALLVAQKEEEKQHTVSLVACPSSLVLNWESEVKKFAPSLRAVPIVGTAPEREALLKEYGTTADLLITSYDLLKRDVEQYTTLTLRYAVADEAQYLKNQNTQNAKAVKALRCEVRFALTGTPVENSLAELWSVFDFLMPGYLHHYAKFRNAFETPIVKQGDEAAAKRLHRMVSPFLLRRMKSDVLKELPEKIETVLTAELAGEQKAVYLAAAVAARQELDAGLGSAGSDKLQILAMITRLRQLCCDPALVYENYTQGSAKLELCIELLQSCIESGHRVLLFSQFTSMLARIATRLETLDIDYMTLTGATAVSGRLELVNSFNTGTVPVFLISLKAGGTGLNLTGADVVIHYDPWWNSSAQNQATDRAHRIGQTRTVQVYKLIVKGTIEERILAMQQAKADLADLVVREGDGAFARMSREEILGLFE